MMVKRLASLTGVFLLGLGLATSAQAEKFSVTGGGGQLHIGNGLALPIQQAALGPVNAGTVFPGEPGTAFDLLIEPDGNPIIEGSIGNALTSASGKQAYQNTLTVQPGVLNRNGSQVTVGVKFSNDVAIAVGTNLNYSWPAGPGNAVFSTGNAIGGAGVVNFGISSLVYTNALANRFGGAAQFAISGNSGTGLLAGQQVVIGSATVTAEDAPVTVYITVGAIGGGCCPGTGAVGLVAAVPTGNGGVGGTTTTTVNTPGIALAPNVAAGAFGASPSGQPLAMPALVATNTLLPTNAATSQGAPWTTGRIVAKNGRPSPDNETFTLTGNDGRTALGGGTIQMVSGAVSARVATKENANRGWVQLNLNPVGVTPALGPVAQLALGGLVLLAGGYVARRKFSASA